MEQVALTPTGVVALRVRQLRSERQWSAQRLAEEVTAVGIEWNRGVVTKLETGRRESISVAELMALACAFNVSPIALVVPNRPVAYALAPRRVAESILRVYDWITGRAGLPFGEQQPTGGWTGIPAGLPDYLENRERHLAAERDRAMTTLQIRNAELEAEAKAKPHANPEALLALMERTERHAQEAERRAAEAEARAERQAKLFRDLATNAPEGIRTEVLAIITAAHLESQKSADADPGASGD